MTVALARRFIVEVAPWAATAPDVWTGIAGVNDFDYELAATTEDTTDFDTDGYTSKEKTAQGWTNTIKAFRRVSIDGNGKPTVFDPGAEIVRAAHDKFQNEARVWTRWYDRNGADEAYEGLALVQWKLSKTGVTNVQEVTITLDGDGARTAIDNPLAVAAVPAIDSATPTGQTAGKAVLIKGDGFTGATAVTFGGTAATSYTVDSDGELTAVLPAGAAGSAPIVVTNATGASAALPYTRGA